MEEVFKYKEKEYFVDKSIIIKDDEDEEKIWNGIKELTTKKYVGLKNDDIIHLFKDEEDEKEVNNLKMAKAFVRPSGTEDILRLYSEAETKEEMENLAQNILNLF